MGFCGNGVTWRGTKRGVVKGVSFGVVAGIKAGIKPGTVLGIKTGTVLGICLGGAVSVGVCFVVCCGTGIIPVNSSVFWGVGLTSLMGMNTGVLFSISLGICPGVV